MGAADACARSPLTYLLIFLPVFCLPSFHDLLTRRRQALLGFCKRNGVSPSDVIVKADGGSSGSEYVFARVTTGGRSAAEVLSEELPALLAGLQFGKTMRWNSEVKGGGGSRVRTEWPILNRCVVRQQCAD